MKYVFLGSARCFHTEDWYKSAKLILNNEDCGDELYFITDQIDGEGYKSFLDDSDSVLRLLVIDRFLFKEFSRLGSVWRNLIKILFLPIQIFLLKKNLKNLGSDVVIHAHSTYYAFLASFCNCTYISTPQGSEILVRLNNFFYRKFASQAHCKASIVTVDSQSMVDSALHFLGVKPIVVQNGIAIDSFCNEIVIKKVREGILSIRGLFPNYQIDKLLKERNLFNGPALRLCFPFSDLKYYETLKPLFQPHDVVLGKLNREQFHQELSKSKIVVSIPQSDSSPRSVYESIFSGAVAIVANNGYVSELPECMRSRLVIVDINTEGWLKKAIELAEVIAGAPYIPSDDARERYDQKHSMKVIINLARNI